jgi:colanic acid/amylovoran biosynthesis glycosyltransferase
VTTPRICLIRPNRGSFSESFVDAHMHGLPADVRVLYGGWFPRWRDEGHLLLPPPLGAARNHLATMPRPLRNPLRLASDLGLAAFLRTAGCELVLAEYGPTGAEVFRACAWAGVPLAVHFHGADAYERATLAAYGPRYPALFAHAAAIIAVSREMETRLLNFGAPRNRLHYLPYGADVNLFQRANPADAPPHFLAVGRFVDKKAPQLTLLAFQQVHAALPEARLTMVGDGVLRESCVRLAEAMGLADVVHFSGPLPHAEIAALMTQMRGFVQHSLVAESGDSEGTPVAIIEAGAAGLPVVATRHAGIVDVVAEGETGMLVHSGDATGMAEAMLILARDPALAKRMGSAAADRARIHFNQRTQLGRLWAILDAARRAGVRR